MAKLTEEQIERLREHWYKSNKHIHISPDGKVIESDTPTDTWWCLSQGQIHLNGNKTELLMNVPHGVMEELIRKLFESGDTTIIEIYYSLNAGYKR